jgi:hypothetical protein
MGISHSILVERAATKGPQGESLSFINGDESEADLKELIVTLTRRCPLGNTHFQCPFRILSGLSYASIIRTVQGLPHEACLQLFEMERECRASLTIPLLPPRQTGTV